MQSQGKLGFASRGNPLIHWHFNGLRLGQPRAGAWVTRRNVGYEIKAAGLDRIRTGEVIGWGAPGMGQLGLDLTVLKSNDDLSACYLIMLR